MIAHPRTARLRPLLPAWLGKTAANVAPVVVEPVSPEPAPRWTLWTDIEAFLSQHEIAPTPASFEIAHAYLTGDGSVRAPIEAVLRDEGRIDEATIETIATARERRNSTYLAEMAGQLEGRLGDVLALIGQSATSAREYGNALDGEVQQAADDPAGTVARLIAMTREVVAATGAMEARLDAMRAETEKLKGDLERARRAARCDHLTGLPNRRSFDAMLTEAAHANGCVALCDIDNFKLINDRHGHETGDRVLRFVAKLLKRELRGKAVVARYGGEEFACVFPDGDLSAARAHISAI